MTKLLALGLLSLSAFAADLSSYRSFQLGADLAAIVKQSGANPALVTVVHQRPALIQELEWHPPGSQAEPAKELIFGFLDGALYRIAVNYDRHETEGMTSDDLIEAVSATYGLGAKPDAPANATVGRYGDREVVIAQWQDPQYRFDLIRSSYGPTFRLICVLKTLDASAQTAITEAKRLDDEEAPQRYAARLATDEEAAKAKLDKARLVNKPKFRP